LWLDPDNGKYLENVVPKFSYTKYMYESVENYLELCYRTAFMVCVALVLVSMLVVNK